MDRRDHRRPRRGQDREFGRAAGLALVVATVGAPYSAPANRNVPSIIGTQCPPTWADTIAPACLRTRVNNRLGRPMSTPCPIRSDNSASRSPDKSASSAAAAAVALPVAGSSERPLDPG